MFLVRAFFGKSPLQRCFVAIAATTCVLMAIVTPPLQAADEYLHFYRAYQMSIGQFVPTRHTGVCSGYSEDFAEKECLGGELPRSLLTTTRSASAEDLRFHPDRKQDLASMGRLWSIALDPDDRQFLKFSTTGLQAPVGHLPLAIGLAVSRTLSFDRLPPVALMYIGRLTHAALWIGTIYFAMAIAPEFELGWFAIGLLPMALFQAASLSADITTNSLACLLVAVAWRYRSRPFESAVVPVAISAVAVLLAVSKLAYVPMALLLYLVPSRSFTTIVVRSRCELTRWLWLVATAGVSVASIVGWSRVLDRIYASLHPDLDPTVQVAGILANPLGFLGTAIATLVENAGLYLHQFVGVFGWLDTPLPVLHVGIYALFLLWACCVSGRTAGGAVVQMGWRDRAVAALGMLGSVGLVCTLAYLWNAVGADRIGGIQGRYFVAIAPLMPVAIGQVIPAIGRRRMVAIAVVLGVGSGISAIGTIVLRYYAIGV